ncbi:MAG: 50S ribosomal protein L9 [Patescibacteria group bacterium]|nr:50S ribosomal protein L9 [Patescibacteria group bacterium]
MKIILLQDVPKVGKKFEVKEVSDGFAINFLFPKKLAELATNQIIEKMTVQKEKYEKKRKLEGEELKKVIGQLKETIQIEVKTSEEGKLFAGLDKKEIVQAIQDKLEIIIDPEILQLSKPIKEVGEYEIRIELGEAKGKLKVEVKSLS